jgi:hypothetical protein
MKPKRRDDQGRPNKRLLYERFFYFLNINYYLDFLK